MLRVGLLRVTSPQGRPALAVNLRPATAKDFSAVKKLLVANRLPPDGVPSSLENFLVAQDGKKLVGAIGLELYGSTALLRSAVVNESARGSEIGARLVEGVLAKARVLGVREVYLLTTTAEKYFPRFGFAVVPRETAPSAMLSSAEFTGACPSSAVLMKKGIDAGTRR